jgi:multiple sugar transport system permease protein
MTLAVPAAAVDGRKRRGRVSYGDLDGSMRRYIRKATVTLFAVMLCVTYLLPLAYGFISGLKSNEQMTDPNQPILPMSADTATIDGEEYPVMMVPFDDGTRVLALVDKGREASVFVDPDEPDVPIEWEGRWRTLEPSMTLDPQWDNFSIVAETLELPKLLFNTGVIAGLGMAGAVISSVLVAYGLSRFKIPFEKLILASLIAAIILPRFVTIVPTYAVYERLGWIGTWLPLIVPHFFANAYNVFLLRAFFMTIPRELDEAATIDGAGPLRILWTIIVPQARAAIVAVSLFHFFFAWNDFFEPFVYLAGDRDKYPISVGLYGFIGLYNTSTNLIQAGAIIAMTIPILVFCFGQRFFTKGIDISGSLK